MTSVAPPCLRINGRPVIVTAVLPPIPLDRFDYAASFADGDESDPVGYGRTPVAACIELKELSDET